MRNKHQILVDCFLSGNFESYNSVGSISANKDKIQFNDEPIVFKEKEVIYIEQNLSSNNPMITILNSFPCVDAIEKGGKVIINGIEWDGKKAKLSLFTE